MKDSNRQCGEFQELIPIWFNGALDQSEVDRLRSHIRDCSDCRHRYSKERRLFAEAKMGGDKLLPENVDSALLDRYVFEPEGLSYEEKQAVDELLAKSEIAVDVVERLRDLPQSLDDLLPADERKRLDTLESEIAQQEPAVSSREAIVDTRPRRYTAWLAAAAAVVLLAIVAVRLFLGDQPSARLEVVLPTTMRGEQEISFTTPASPFVLDARMYVGPEEGHTYDIELLPAHTDSVMLRLPNYQDFDETGFAVFSHPLDTGRYRVRIYDIYGGDTLLIRRPFEVRLAP